MRGLHGFDALPTRVVRYCDTVGITVPTGYTIVRPPRRNAQESYRGGVVRPEMQDSRGHPAGV